MGSLRRVLRDEYGLEQCLRGLEVSRREFLGEASVDRSQEVTGRRGPSLPMPATRGEAGMELRDFVRQSLVDMSKVFGERARTTRLLRG